MVTFSSYGLVLHRSCPNNAGMSLNDFLYFIQKFFYSCIDGYERVDISFKKYI